MFYNLEKSFGTDGKKLYEGFIENAKEDIPKIVEENIIVLRAMKKADLPQYMLRRVVYDNYGVSPESFGRQLRRIYANERFEEFQEDLDKISLQYNSLLNKIGFCYNNMNNKRVNFKTLLQLELRGSIEVKPFTDYIYATLRPIIDKALDEI